MKANLNQTMKNISFSHVAATASLFIGFIFSGCSETWNTEEQGIPQFVKTNYIELDKIQQISRFRSSEGHDYSDSYEHCRSMKHYFQPFNNINWGEVKIISPVSGTIRKVYDEWAGTQLHIESDEYPAFRFIIFHVRTTKNFKPGDHVKEGQQLGTHYSNETTSDIAVSVNQGAARQRLVSYFEVMTDNLFASYVSRGVSGKDELIISRQERDADPLICDGENFLNMNEFDNWVTLH